MFIFFLFLTYLANADVMFEGEIKQVKLTSVHKDGSPADRVNLAFEVPSQSVLLQCFYKAGWKAADSLTFTHLAKEVGDILKNKSYDGAPVSTLMLFGRKQDLAFEIPVGNSPRIRHHMRLWRSDFSKPKYQVWFAAAVFDTGVDWKHFTHSTDLKIDKERAFVDQSLKTLPCFESNRQIEFLDPAHEKDLISDNKGDIIRLK